MIIRNLIVIPTYNNNKTIVKVVQDCLKETPFPILVVDDGSLNNVENLFKDDIKRLHFLRHNTNQGKGKAIQSAINWGISNNFTHITTIDGDGQHYPQDILPLTMTAKENPFAVIIGKRKFNESHDVPQISRFGRNFSNFWVKYQTDIAIEDSQSGFRIYPLFHLQSMSFFTSRYDFEIEVLIRCIWKDVKVVEKEINVYYPPKEERVTHFRKFKDNAKISILNTILVAVTLLRGGLSPHKLTSAIALGIIIGCTPFFGLHALIILPLSICFRLNYLLLLLGTQISIPPMIPFLVSSSLYLGSKVTHTPLALSTLEFSLQEAQKQLSLYFIGSLILGCLIAIMLAPLLYFLSSMALKKRTTHWNGKMRGGIGNHFMIFILKHCGLKTAYFFLYFITPYFLLFAPQARRSLSEYWQALYPSIGFFSKYKKILGHFLTFGKIILDRVYQSLQSSSPFKISFHGHDLLHEKSPSMFLLGAHVGGWNLSSAYMKNTSEQKTLYLLQYRPPEKDLMQLLTSSKRKEKIVYLDPTQNPFLEIKKAIEAQHLIGVLGDRVMSGNIELVKFLGKLAPFDTNTFRLASILETNIAYIFSARLDQGHYQFTLIEGRKTSSQLNAEENHYSSLQDYVSHLEVFIKTYPQQWLNFYPFWSSFPEDKLIKVRKERSYLREELGKPTTN